MAKEKNNKKGTRAHIMLQQFRARNYGDAAATERVAKMISRDKNTVAQWVSKGIPSAMERPVIDAITALEHNLLPPETGGAEHTRTVNLSLPYALALYYCAEAAARGMTPEDYITEIINNYAKMLIRQILETNPILKDLSQKSHPDND